MENIIIKTVHETADFLGHARPTYSSMLFSDWKQIDTRDKGVYVIFDENTVIYVGKGKIRSRQPKHWQKALGEFKDARDTVGWRWLRENRVISPNAWHILTISDLTATKRSAFEGVLIDKLQPLANDEVFEDRG